VRQTKLANSLVNVWWTIIFLCFDLILFDIRELHLLICWRSIYLGDLDCLWKSTAVCYVCSSIWPLCCVSILCYLMADSDPVSSANFYSLCEQSDTSSLAYCTAGIPSVQTSSTSGASGPYMPAIATSPDLDALDVPPYRPRSHSAPSILYQQVALQLRGISDEFNREYSRNQVFIEFH